MWTQCAFPLGSPAQRHHVADLHLGRVDHHPIDLHLHDLALLRESRLAELLDYPRSEVFHLAGKHLDRKLIFQRLSKKLGIKLHPHKLRHTFSTDFLSGGGSVAHLQRLLGHESPQMSLYYAHVSNGEAVDRQRTNSVVDSQFRRAR